MREHADRVAANFVAGWAPRHCEEFLAVSSHPRQPFATLRQVLMDTPLREPRYYRVLVRLWGRSWLMPQSA